MPDSFLRTLLLLTNLGASLDVNPGAKSPLGRAPCEFLFVLCAVEVMGVDALGDLPE
jgi:hypothetical protein